MRKLFIFILFVFFFRPAFSQTLTSEGDYDVSSTTFPGFIRAGVTDVHSPTGVVVYVYQDTDASGQGVFCKIYNEQMVSLKGQFQVNVNTANSQFNGFVKVNERDNSFLVIWSSNHTGDYDVYMRKYDLNGNALTGEVQVNDANTGTQYAIRLAFDYSRNEAVVLYRDDAGQDGSAIGAYAKRFNYSDLTAIGSQFQVNQVTASNQVPGDIGIIQSTGDLIVLFHSNHSGNYDIYRSVFHYDGSTYVNQSETLINSYTSSDQYYEYLSINQTSGQYVIVWGSAGGDGSGWAVFSQIFDISHSQVKSEFLVNSDGLQNQILPKAVWIESVNQIVYFFHYMYSGFSTVKYRVFDGYTTPGEYVAVANDADAIGAQNTYDLWGSSFFSAHYNSYDQKVFLSYDLYNSNWTNDSRIRARTFDFTHPDLHPVSTSLTAVNDYDVSPTNFPGFARVGVVDVHDGSGKVVTVFQDTDADGEGVFCKIYDENMTQLVSQFQVNVNTASNQIHAYVKVNQNDNSFAVVWASLHSGNYDVYIRKYDLNGTPLTGEVMVNNADPGTQYAPKVAFDYNRNEIVVVFRDDNGQDLGGAGSIGTFARRFDYSNLSPIGNQFCINQIITANQVPTDVGIVQSTGDLIVVFHSNHISSNGYDVYKTVFHYNSTSGVYDTPVETRINNYYSGDQYGEYICINQRTGDYLICWGSGGGDGAGWAVYSKIFNSSHEQIKNEFRINSDYSQNQIMPRAIWEESINNIVFFFHYMYGGYSTVKYRIYDGSTGDYVPLSDDMDALNGENTYNLWAGAFFAASYNNNIYLAYDLFNSSFTSDSRVKLKKFGLNNPNNPELEEISPCILTDLNMNWTQVREFDEDGNVISESRTYSDKLGRTLQTQTRNVEDSKILVVSNVYDAMGRTAITSLPAPIANNENCFAYTSNFVSNPFTNNPYNYYDFDMPIQSGNLGEINTPVWVGTQPNTVGWYYSNNNTLEPYVATTGYPYSRVYYNDAIGGGATRATKPGDVFKMGAGHEVTSVTVPILWELNHYLKLRNYFVPGVVGQGIPSDYSFKGTKTISKDENGNETVAFYSKDGKLLATAALTGAWQTNIGQNQYTDDAPSDNFSNTYRFTYNVCTTSCTNYYSITGSGNVEIYINGDFSTPYYIGTIANYNATIANNTGASAFPDGSDVFIQSSTSFTVNYQGSSYNSAAWTSGVYFKNYLDIHMPVGEENSISITGTYQIYNLVTGQTVTYTSNPLPAGYYRIVNTNPASEVMVNYKLNYYDFTYYYYDDAGRAVATVSPNGVNFFYTTAPSFVTSNTYNTIGQVMSTTNPDEGTTQFIYRQDGSLRFSQNAEQALNNKLSYNHYDNIGRAVESGEYDFSGTGNNWTYYKNNEPTITSFPAASCQDVSYIVYDLPDNGLSGQISGYTQSFVDGSVSTTYKKDNGSDAQPVSQTWYSYNEMGLTEWVVKNINGLGVKTVDYTYDLDGNVLNVSYQQNSSTERFDHFYQYDHMQRLSKVLTSLNNGTQTEQAEYLYYIHGPLKRKELADNLQGIDYTYTITGSLKAINHPSLDDSDPGLDSYPENNYMDHSGFFKDVFGMVLEYYDDDYSRNGYFPKTTNLTSLGYGQYYNGNIRSCTWNTQPGATTPTPAQYAYNYDKKYQLTRADFGSNSANAFTKDASNRYKVTLEAGNGGSYDDNGNIKSLERYDQNGSLSTANNIQYFYNNNNQLYYTTINSFLAQESNRGYTYDAIGRMIAAETWVSGEVNKYLTYDVENHVTAVYADAAKTQPMASFLYDETGQRIRKTSYDASHNPTHHTWYVRDASGKLLSIYNTDVTVTPNVTTQTELPVYGSGREGVYYVGLTEYDYELTDHLGNVRATVRKYNGSLNVVSYADYYPYGSTMQGRTQAASPAYRNGYQGQYAEHDPETGWEDFELRMFDPGLARWISPDPKHIGASPYIGMANNPILMVDPDGGGPGDWELLGFTQYDIPVWGAAAHSSDAIDRGDYLDAASWFAVGVIEICTFGYASEVKIGKTALKLPSKKPPLPKPVPPLRLAYETEVKGLSAVVDKMRTAGHSSEEIARTLHAMRRELGIKFKDLTPPDLLETIYKRNLGKYGDKLGPTIDYFRKQGKTWEEIIKTAITPGGEDINFIK